MRGLVLVVVVACSGAQQPATGEAGFRIAYPDAPPTGAKAKVGKRFYARAVGSCNYDNGREARWTITGARVESGELPPGIGIEDGAITGSPTKAGTYDAKIKISGVTCAGKQVDPEVLDVKIVVQ